MPMNAMYLKHIDSNQHFNEWKYRGNNMSKCKCPDCYGDAILDSSGHIYCASCESGITDLENQYRKAQNEIDESLVKQSTSSKELLGNKSANIHLSK